MLVGDLGVFAFYQECGPSVVLLLASELLKNSLFTSDRIRASPDWCAVWDWLLDVNCIAMRATGIDSWFCHVCPRSSRKSHARAKSQSRCTVRKEMPRTSAVSSALRPPKNRSSTI